MDFMYRRTCIYLFQRYILSEIDFCIIVSYIIFLIFNLFFCILITLYNKIFQLYEGEKWNIIQNFKSYLSQKFDIYQHYKSVAFFRVYAWFILPSFRDRGKWVSLIYYIHKNIFISHISQYILIENNNYLLLRIWRKNYFQMF